MSNPTSMTVTITADMMPRIVQAAKRLREQYAEDFELTGPPDLDEEDDGTSEPPGPSLEQARARLKSIASQPYSEDLRRQTQARVRARYARHEQGRLL